MRFQPGQSGNPAGRPKGTKSGRMQALGVLDGLLKDDAVLESLSEGLKKALERVPVWFFRRIIMPLLPKDATVQFDKKGAIQWVRLTIPIGPLMLSSVFRSRLYTANAPAGSRAPADWIN